MPTTALCTAMRLDHRAMSIASASRSRRSVVNTMSAVSEDAVGKFKMAKHFHLDITDTTLAVTRDNAYKNLARVERDFRSLKTIDLDLRPIHHRRDDRVKACVLICMLAVHLTWHLRKALAPLTFTDETHPHARTLSPPHAVPPPPSPSH